MSDRKVTFRRIRGRIVPIETKGEKTAKGVALTTAGVVAGASAGNMAARATKSAAHFRVHSNIYAEKAKSLIARIRRVPTQADKLETAGQMAFGFTMNPSAPKSAAYAKIAVKHALKAQSFKILKKGLKAGGMATATSLISSGLKNTYEGVTGKTADTKTEVISTAAGAGATFALSSAYFHKRLGGGTKHLMKAFKFGLRVAKIKV